MVFPVDQLIPPHFIKGAEVERLEVSSPVGCDQ